MLNQNSATPLYLQLCDLILSEIKNGKYKEGEKIPSELELCEQYNLSRTTIRAAIAALTNQDILVRRQGKGTFVKTQKPTLALPKEKRLDATSLLAEGGFALGNHAKLTSRFCFRRLIPATKNDILALGLSPEEQVLLFVNSFYVDGRPAAMEEYFLHPRYAALERLDLESLSIWDVLEREYGIQQVSCSRKTIEIARATKEEASVLRICKGDPLLLLRQVVCAQDGSPILRIKECVLGNTYKYVV